MPYSEIGNIGVMTAVTNASFAHSNNCNFLTLDNIGLICDDISWNGSYVSGTTLFTLTDTNMAPLYEIIIPIQVTSNNETNIEKLHILPNGSANVENSFYNPIFHTSGIQWNVNNKYYTPDIGNIDPANYTSPF